MGIGHTFLYFSYKYIVQRRLAWHMMLNFYERSAPEEINALEIPLQLEAMLQSKPWESHNCFENTKITLKFTWPLWDLRKIKNDNLSITF